VNSVQHMMRELFVPIKIVKTKGEKIMGFMDKMKEAGKGVLKGALTMAATSYGVVQTGKHKLCKVCMNSTYDKITFVKLTTVEEEYVIKDSIKTFYVYDEDNANGYHVIKVLFNDGEESTIHLTYEKDRGSALPTVEQRLAAQYEKAAYLIEALAKYVPEITDETKKWVNKIMLYAGKKVMF